MGIEGPCSLMRRTKELLSDRDFIKVSAETGINYHWLAKFARGRVNNPSVNTVQALYEYLTETKLALR